MGLIAATPSFTASLTPCHPRFRSITFETIVADDPVLKVKFSIFLLHAAVKLIYTERESVCERDAQILTKCRNYSASGTSGLLSPPDPRLRRRPSGT